MTKAIKRIYPSDLKNLSDAEKAKLMKEIIKRKAVYIPNEEEKREDKKDGKM